MMIMVMELTLQGFLRETEERQGESRCAVHPLHRRSWMRSEATAYAADMNVALSYYKCLDDWQDDHKRSARAMANILEKNMPRIRGSYPRQCDAIAHCIAELSRLEQENCSNPDQTANCFGELMAELMVFEEDLWAGYLRQLGYHLGRFIYLLDAAADFERDKKQGKYNPFLAMGMAEPDWKRWEDYLVLTMARCTESYEKLPLVQDKDILDNILYSGIWLHCRANTKKEDTADDHGSV